MKIYKLTRYNKSLVDVGFKHRYKKGVNIDKNGIGFFCFKSFKDCLKFKKLLDDQNGLQIWECQSLTRIITSYQFNFLMPYGTVLCRSINLIKVI